MGAPYVEPFTFLALRFGMVLLIFVSVLAVMVKKWPRASELAHSVVVGVFIHGIYLGGVFYAIDNGMSAGVSALIVSLQPLITAVLARMFLQERFGWVRAAWLLVAFIGVGLVVLPKLEPGGLVSAMSPINLAIVFVSAIAISIGTVYQKRFTSNVDLRVGAIGQYLGAFLFVVLPALLLEENHIEWHPEFIFALVWLIFVLSVGAVGLLMFLIRHSDVSSVASLFFLVPAVAAVMAYFLFDERLEILQLCGMALVMFAVAMAVKRAKGLEWTKKMTRWSRGSFYWFSYGHASSYLTMRRSPICEAMAVMASSRSPLATSK